MSDIDDAEEFIQAGSKYVEEKDTLRKVFGRAIDDLDTQTDNKVKPGQPVQYSIYGEGYTSTTNTIKSLPPGCYDISVDQRCVYVVPAAKPSGILLELPEMKSEDVIRVVQTFWDSEKDYKEGNNFIVGGAAYKTGIMIFGPPGSGKSCTIKILANKLVERGGTVFYSSGSPEITSRFLRDFSLIEKDRKCIVILEDIDSLIYNYGESGYLEMLDSSKTVNNVLFIATTNYPDRLDPRIYNRPGRFSHVIKIGLPTKKAREAFLRAVLKDHRDVDQIVKESDGFTIDHLSSLISGVYREKKPLDKELKRLRALFTIPKVDEGLDQIGFNSKERE